MRQKIKRKKCTGRVFHIIWYFVVTKDLEEHRANIIYMCNCISSARQTTIFFSKLNLENWMYKKDEPTNNWILSSGSSHSLIIYNNIKLFIHFFVCWYCRWNHGFLTSKYTQYELKNKFVCNEIPALLTKRVFLNGKIPAYYGGCSQRVQNGKGYFIVNAVKYWHPTPGSKILSVIKYL